MEVAVKKRIICVGAILIMFFSVVSGVEESTADRIAALEKKLEKAVGKEKIHTILEIGELYRQTSAAESIRRCQQALELSRQLEYPEGEAIAYNTMAIATSMLGDLDKGLEYFLKALEIHKKRDDKKGISRVVNNIGIVYRRSGNYEKALEYFYEALKVEQEMGQKDGIALALLNLGNIHADRADYNNSLDYFMQAMKIFEELKDKKYISMCLHNIGNIYIDLQNPQLALQYQEKSLKTSEEIGDKYDICNGLIAVGLNYQELKNIPMALEYFQKAVKLAREIGDQRGLSYALGSIGSIHQDLKSYKKALTYYKDVLSIDIHIQDSRHEAMTYHALGYCYLQLGEYEKAKENFDLGLKIGKELKAKGLLKESYENFSKLYAQRGDYKKALECYQLFHQTDKEILNENSSRQINELQARYEDEKKANEIAVLKKNSEIKDLRLDKAKLTRNAFIIGFLMVLIILGLMFKKYVYLFSFWKKQKFIGQYRLMDKIGSGSMGTIYKAHNIVNKSKLTAVKILRDELFSDEVNRKRFHREAAIIDKLEHPNIIKIYERGETKQALFLAMEFLAGKTLEQKIVEEGQLMVTESLHILVQVSDALAYIHGQNIIHRDLKPANIMLIEKDGDPNFVKLLDFGLAKMELSTQLTESGNFLGTLQYVAPEQVLNADSSPANDIFSLGVMIYRMLCGRSPFSGESPIEIMRKIIIMEPPELSPCRGEIPPELNRLMMDMLKKEPSQRPTAKEIHVNLKKILSARV